MLNICEGFIIYLSTEIIKLCICFRSSPVLVNVWSIHFGEVKMMYGELSGIWLPLNSRVKG